MKHKLSMFVKQLKNLAMNLFRIGGILITIILLFLNFKGELIEVNDGAGWDGRLYASYTAHLDESIAQKGINEYRFQRILMSVALNKTMKAFNVDFTVPNVVMGFKIFNLVFLLIALLYYYLISNKLKLTPELEFLGLMCLFWCYPVLKMPGFNPIITDVGAFSMGMMVAYHFLCNHRIVNILLILLGSFVYPTFILFGFLLFFPKETYESSNKSFRPERFILPGIFLLCFVGAYFGYYSEFSDTYADVNPTNNNALFLSFLLALGYCYLIGAFLPDFKNIKEAISKVKWIYIVPIVLIFIFVKYMTGTYASPQPLQMSSGRYVINIMKQSVANPAVFLVSHIIYLGWLPLILIFMGKEMHAAIRSLGYGVAILFAGLGIMSLGSETRQLINFYPFLVVVALMALSKKQALKPWVLVVLGLSALALSRFWYSINGFGDIGKKLLEFPAQRYFQVFGPWMSNTTYFINLVICILGFVTLFILQKTGNFLDPIKIAKQTTHIQPKKNVGKKHK